MYHFFAYLTNVQGTIVAFFAMLAVDAGGVMATTNANSTSLILAFSIKTLPFGLHLWVKITLIGMAKTLGIIKICDARVYLFFTSPYCNQKNHRGLCKLLVYLCMK